MLSNTLMKKKMLYLVCRRRLKSMDTFGILPHSFMYKSPWARNKDDEEYFNDTLMTLGNLVKDDVKLGTLYTTLVLITPKDEKVIKLWKHILNSFTQNNILLADTQNGMKLLLYRYLKHKFKDSERANQVHSLLLE